MSQGEETLGLKFHLGNQREREREAAKMKEETKWSGWRKLFALF